MHLFQLALRASAITRVLLLYLSTARLISALPQAASSPSFPSDPDPGPGPNQQPPPPFNLQLQKAVIYAQPDLEGPIMSLSFKALDVSGSNNENSESDSSDLTFSTTLGYPARFRTSEYRRNRPPTLSPEGELLPPPSRVPLPEPLTQRWKRVVQIGVGDVPDDGLNRLLGSDDEGGSGGVANLEVSLHNYRGPEDFAVRIKLAESAGPIWSVDLKGYMHKLQLKLDPEPLDIAYTSEPEKLPPFVMVRDEDSGSNVTGS